MTDKELIESLCGIETGLTDWEVGFVESVSKQKFPLTPKQRSKAEKILEDLDTRGARPARPSEADAPF